jgi:hypothetical protein
MMSSLGRASRQVPVWIIALLCLGALAGIITHTIFGGYEILAGVLIVCGGFCIKLWQMQRGIEQGARPRTLPIYPS